MPDNSTLWLTDARPAAAPSQPHIRYWCRCAGLLTSGFAWSSRKCDNDTRSTALYELAVLEQTEGKRDAAEKHLREAIRAPHIPGYGRARATLLRAPGSATASPARRPADPKP